MLGGNLPEIRLNVGWIILSDLLIWQFVLSKLTAFCTALEVPARPGGPRGAQQQHFLWMGVRRVSGEHEGQFTCRSMNSSNLRSLLTAGRSDLKIIGQNESNSWSKSAYFCVTEPLKVPTQRRPDVFVKTLHHFLNKTCRRNDQTRHHPAFGSSVSAGQNRPGGTGSLFSPGWNRDAAELTDQSSLLLVVIFEFIFWNLPQLLFITSKHFL